MDDRSTDELAEWIDHEVVVDVNSPFVYIGRLKAVEPAFLVLADADAHDLRDTPTTRDRYILDCRRHGTHANRRQIRISRREIVAVSRLDDVVTE